MYIDDIHLKSKNNPHIFIVATDDRDYVLHSDIIVKLGIARGECDRQLLYQAENDSAEIIAFNIAIKYISSKIKTEQQIKDYLYKKEFHASTVDAAISKLKEYGVIDDERYAESYVNSNKNFSKMKLKQKLYSFGVNRDMIDDITDEIDDYDSCLMNAKKYIKSKEVTREMIEKLTRRLASQGYAWEIISRVLRTLRMEIEE